MFNKHDISRNQFMLTKRLAENGYDWWWHSFTARHSKTGEEKSFFIEFFLCNPELGGDKPVFGQTTDKPQKPSYIMVKAGCWGKDARQLHRFFGWNKADIGTSVPYYVKAEDCFISEEETYGKVCVSSQQVKEHPEYLCSDGEMSWKLNIKKDIAFNVGYGAGRLFRSLQIFEMFWHAEGMKTQYDGEVWWNGEKYIVTPDTCYGYADKNWGKDFTSPWVWLSSNNLTSKVTGKRLKNSVFDIGGGRPKAGPVALKRKLLSAFYYEGKEFEFNFSKFWTFTRTSFDCKETDTQIIWHVEQKTWLNRMVTDIICEKEDMLLVKYEAPNGLILHKRLWNGGNGKGTIKLYRKGKLIDEIYAENVGCEYGEY